MDTQSDIITTWHVLWEPVGSPSLAVALGLRDDRVSVGPTNGQAYTTEADIPRILALRFSVKVDDVRIVHKSAEWTR